MSIEITMRHSDVRIEALKAYAEQRMEQLKANHTPEEIERFTKMMNREL